MDKNSPATQTSSTEDDLPQKYIRTYGGDIETIKKGEAPDLAPFIEPPEEIKGSKEAKEPEKPQPAAPQPAPTADKKPPRHELSPVSQVPEFERITPPEGALQTYSGDFLNRVKETQASTATVIAAEQDSLKGEPSADVPKKVSRITLAYSVAGVVLLVVSGVGGYVAYTKYASQQHVVVPTPTVASPLPVDERVLIAGTGSALAQALVESARVPLASGSVRLLYTASSTPSASSTPESVLEALKTSAPAVLLRNIDAERSMAGVVQVGGSQSIFFIVGVSTYGESFSGMLQWEPRIRQDLALLFPPYPEAPAPIVATSSLAATSSVKSTASTKGSPKATSTPVIPLPVPAPVVPLAFVDDVIANHDVRIYRDTEGRSILLYGYWNPTTLIIARDPAAFADVLQRLGTARAQP